MPILHSRSNQLNTVYYSLIQLSPCWQYQLKLPVHKARSRQQDDRLQPPGSTQCCHPVHHRERVVLS